jgi:hypothetical protein
MHYHIFAGKMGVDDCPKRQLEAKLIIKKFN